MKLAEALWELMHIAAQTKFISRTLYLRIVGLYTYLQKDVRKIYHVRTD